MRVRFFVFMRTSLLGLIVAACSDGTKEHTIYADTRRELPFESLIITDTAPPCIGCGAFLPPGAPLGKASDTELLRSLPAIARVGSRIVVIAPHQVNHPILIYDRGSGGLIRSISSFGSGPGEFKNIRSVSPLNDHEFIIAHDGRRASVFDTAGVFLRTVNLEMGTGDRLLQLPNGDLLSAGRRSTEDAVGFPLHIMSADGRHDRSFGSPNIISPMMTWDRVIGAAPNGEFFIAEVGMYRVERIDSRGTVKQVIAVAPPPSWGSPTFLTSDDHRAFIANVTERDVTKKFTDRPKRVPVRPPIEMQGLIVCGPDRLRAVLRRPIVNWDAVMIDYRSNSEEVSWEATTYLRLYDTIVDDLSLADGLITRREVVPGYGVVIDERTIGIVKQDQDGVITIQPIEVAGC